MKTTQTLSFGSLVLIGLLAASGTALASSIASDHGLDNGQRVTATPLNDAGINLASRRAPAPGISLAPGAGIDALEYRASAAVLVDTRTNYRGMAPLNSAAGIDALGQRGQ
ncbi:hypothetical protein [Modicisalibacter sp. 'Wilcox']|uniref:hypothetical protein n=1 Tax=Modicisalibacter sp. 'Wilcox' TaxID=2679914 RepID=UPI0013D87F3D|nr:hypothetical protein [Modicisalibacter sp. 'Wilcox']